MSAQHDTANQSPKQGAPLNIILPIILVVLLVAGLGIYFSKAEVEKGLIEQQLEEVALLVGNMSDPQSGIGYSFIYDKVITKGGGVERSAVLTSPLFRYQRVNEAGMIVDALELTTDEILFNYELTDLNSISFELNKPIDIVGKNTALQPKGAVTGEFSRGVDENGVRQTVKIHLPEAGFLLKRDAPTAEKMTYKQVEPIVFSMLHSADGSENLANKLSVAFDSFSVGSVNFPLGARAETFRFEREWEARKGDAAGIGYKVDAQNVTLTGIETPLLPLSLILDARFEGTPSDSFEELQAQLVNSPIYLDVKHGHLTLGNTELQLKGILENEGEGFLPLIDAAVEVREFAPLYDVLVEQGNLDPESEEGVLMELFTQEITGLPMSELQDASFEITRGEDRAFSIGATTFEELVAIWLAQKFSKRQTALEETEIEEVFDESNNATHAPQE